MKNIYQFYQLILVIGLILSLPVYAGGVRQVVHFVSGKQSEALKGAVIRGDRDVYIVKANAQQHMTVHITSDEDNAVFSIQLPNGKELKNAAEGDDATHWTGKLPVSGRYKIIVGGTRGNASYQLIVRIK